MATYIAHGDVALSVLMTTASTLGAIFMTPLLTKLLAGTLVPVDAKVVPTYLWPRYSEAQADSNHLHTFQVILGGYNLHALFSETPDSRQVSRETKAKRLVSGVASRISVATYGTRNRVPRQAAWQSEHAALCSCRAWL